MWAIEMDEDDIEWFEFSTDLTPTPLYVHTELEARVAEVVGSEMDYLIRDIDLLYTSEGTTLIAMLYELSTAILHCQEIPCTRLERVQWGLEEDPYRACQAADGVAVSPAIAHKPYSCLEVPSICNKEKEVGFDCQHGEEFEI